MVSQRNGTRGQPRERENGRDDREKGSPPVFTRKLWTPSGTLELAIFEKQVQGTRKDHTNFFVTLNRSYPDPDHEGEYKKTTVLNPQDLLIAADLYKIAWDFVLSECNRE